MTWTTVNSIASSTPPIVNQRLTVLEVFMQRILDNTNEAYSEDTRIALRSNARILQGIARELRNDLGITE